MKKRNLAVAPGVVAREPRTTLVEMPAGRERVVQVPAHGAKRVFFHWSGH